MPDHVNLWHALGRIMSPTQQLYLLTFPGCNKINYGAICGIYILSWIGLGGNVPIDALLLWSSCHRIVVTLWPSWECSSQSELWLPLPSPKAQLLNPDTMLSFPPAQPLNAERLAILLQATWVVRYMVILIGAMTLAIFFRALPDLPIL
jgi:hypothetical protein